MRTQKTFAMPLIAAVLLAALLSGCRVTNGVKGNGKVATVDVSASDFSGVAIKGTAGANIKFGSGYSVKVTTDSNIQQLVRVTVSDGILNITETEGHFDADIMVDITLPKLESMEISGAGSAVIASGKADEFEFAISGMGNLDAKSYQVKNVTAYLSGLGSADVWATDVLNGKISGVGSINYKGDPQLNVSSSGLGNFNPL